MATGMIGKKPIIGPIADQQEITGRVNNAIQMAFYKGLETDTAKVTIDNTKVERTIQADVKRTPGTLTITDKSDELWVVSEFNGSEDVAIELKNYTISRVEESGIGSAFALFKNGIQEGETISIPNGETIDTASLIAISDIPYLRFTFKNSSRVPLDCSLEGLGIAEILSRISKAESDIKDLQLNNIYRSLDKVKPYLYEIDFDTIDYDYAKEYFRSKQAEVSVTGCSAVRNGNFYGRNFDWTYGEGVDFVVRVPSYKGRYASIGISSAVSLAQFTEAFVDSKEKSELYKIIPFYMVDAINEKGLFINTNVVPLDHEPSEPTVPTGSKEDEICSLMLPRYVVDHFATADEAISYLQEHVSIYMFKKLQDMHYELHCLIGDENKTYVLEFINNQLVATPWNKITNFYIDGVTFNEDGKVYTPETQDSEHDAIKTNGVTPRGSGLERYNIIINNFSTSNTKEGMRALMDNLIYSKAYTNTQDKWYTEFVGDYDNNTVHYTCASSKDYYETNIIPSINDNVIHYTKELYLNRTRSSGDTWQTVHSCVYDINQRKLYVIAQEDGVEYSFDLLHYYTASKVDSLIDDKTVWEKGIGDYSVQTKGIVGGAAGPYSVAEGKDTLSEGLATHSEGQNTQASGDGSHAEGIQTHAGALGSHAEGGWTATSDINEANYSHVEGLNNGTNNIAEHAEGKYGWSYYGPNKTDAEKSIHFVGIGTADQDQYRKNAETIMINGDKYVIGIGGYDGKDIVSADTVQNVINQTIIDLNTETQNRISGDSSLQSALTQEATTRKDTDDDLQDQINNLKARGRYLSIWNAVSGLPADNPVELPYNYKAGDYYIVGRVATESGEVNYQPDGLTYAGSASTKLEERELHTNDNYYFDGTKWALQSNTQKEITFSNIAGNPRDNINLSNELTTLENNINTHKADKNNPHEVTKNQIGLGNVENKSSSTIRSEITSSNIYNALGYTAANDSNVVHRAGSELISGTKTFNNTTYFSGINTGNITPKSNNYYNVGSSIYRYYITYTNYISNGSSSLAISYISQKLSEIDEKSTVTASSTGTSTDEVNYLTIDGTEYKIGGSGGSGYAIVDYEDDLPEITTDNKDSLARLGGDEVYAAEYREQQGEQVELLVQSTTSNQPSKALAQEWWDVNQTYVTINTINNVKGFFYNTPEEEKPYCPFNIGSNKNTGSINFTLKNTVTTPVTLLVRAYISSGKARPTSIFITHPDGDTRTYYLSTELNDNDFPVATEITLYDIGTYTITGASVQSEDIVNNMFLLSGIRFGSSAQVIKNWHQLARKEYVDEEIANVNETITQVQEQVDTNTADIEVLQEETSDLGYRVSTIETDMGTVQIFDADELPELDKKYLNKIFRVNKKLYQLTQNGDGFIKNYSFENITGDKEITGGASWDSFAGEVTDGFKWDFELNTYITQDWKPAESMRTDGTEYRTIDFSKLGTDDIEVLDEAGIYTATRCEGAPDFSIDFPVANVTYVKLKPLDGTLQFFDSIKKYNIEATDVSPKLYLTSQDNIGFNDDNLQYLEEYGDVINYKTSKVFRNNGEIKFGSSSAVGYFEILKTDNIELPITKITARVKPWSTSKESQLVYSINGELDGTISLPGSEDITEVTVYDASVESVDNVETIYLGSQKPDRGDYRVRMYSIRVTYGQFEYKWEEISGGANVEIVDELPEVGEENTIYLKRESSSGGSINFEEVDELPEVGTEGTIYLMDPQGGGGETSFNVEIVDELPEQGEDKKVYLIEDEGPESAGTVTSVSISMNGEVKGTVTTSGTIDLGTVVTDDSGKENVTNKVTTISATSTDTEYPSAKAVYDLIIATINGSY